MSNSKLLLPSNLTSLTAEDVMAARRELAYRSLTDYACMIDIPTAPLTDDEDEDQFSVIKLDTLADHHWLLLSKLQDVEEKIIDNLMVFMPPGSAKSTYVDIVFVPWYMAKHARHNVILASYASPIAQKQGRRARQLLKSTSFNNLFPDVRLEEDNRAADKWALTNGSEYMSAGILSGLTGNRAHLGILDDPIKGREQAESDTIRQKTWDAYIDDFCSRLIPGAPQIMILTRWHEDDPAGRILPEGWNGESGDFKGRDGRNWHVLCLPAIADRADDPLEREVGETLWPEWFSLDHWKPFQTDNRTWSSLYQQKPKPIGGGDFKKEWFCFYKRTPHVGNKILIVDPASGKHKKRGDFVSMWVLGRGYDNNYYIIDGIRDRLSLTERTEAVFDLVKKWRISDVFYEEYGLQADIEHIKDVQETRSFRFRIKPIGGPMPKTDRIKRLVPIIQHAQMWMPETLNKQMKDGTVRDIIQDLVNELTAFPNSRHDDASDCLARIEDEEPKKALKAPSKKEATPVVAQYQPLDPEMGS